MLSNQLNSPYSVVTKHAMMPLSVGRTFPESLGTSHHFLCTEVLARFRSTVPLFLQEMRLFFHAYLNVYVTSPVKTSERNE